MNFNAIKESEMFDKAADYYDKFRPGYPIEIINALVSHTKLDKTARTLEIGAGSGKATEYFKDFGFNIRCIDPGENLITIGNYKFSEYSNISFECERFENLKQNNERYDVIFSAQAFHWIPQPAGYIKCAELLKDKGYLAPFWNMYMTYDNSADNDLLRLSEKYGGFADFVNEEQCEDRINTISKGIENSGIFKAPTVYRHLWSQEYTAEEYYGFALTGNQFLQLPDELKAHARAEIFELAERYGGRIVRPYLCVLYIAEKV